jgi:hypothetical protein
MRADRSAGRPNASIKYTCRPPAPRSRRTKSQFESQKSSIATQDDGGIEVRGEHQPIDDIAETTERDQFEGEAKAGGSKPAGRPWTRAEDGLLRDMLKAGLTAVEIALRLARTPGAIYSRVQYLDRRRRKPGAS